ncbi:MAG: hypothetical protein JWL81_1377 [Verrucomicrobiales bacterium]|nr:hypothetical protein [Verrucomicrobiales bacterium]
MKLLLVNLALWTVAILLHPISRMLPTGSGTPPKILELLIPLFSLLLAGGSTYLLKSAINKSKSE